MNAHATLEVGVPNQRRPESGDLNLSISSPSFVNTDDELRHSVYNAVVGTGALDHRSLCIVPGKSVFL